MSASDPTNPGGGPGYTYRDAGVDIDEGNALVKEIGRLRARTEHRHQLYQAFGLFAASFDLSAWNEPVIVTGCDGVGTKLELLLEHDLLETAGKDLVAMNVNDILTTGGEPVMFLDYLGVPKIDRRQLVRLVAGMVEHLEACGCVLAGGETAEMPGMVADGMVELSGFAIGVAEKSQLLNPSTIVPGDAVVGYASDGFHANGWSLVRRILADRADEFSRDEVRGLLAPTRLYHDVVNDLRGAAVPVRAHAHITGGGLPENVQRLLEHDRLGADLEVPPWPDKVARRVASHVAEPEAFRTFNMGIGWVTVVPPEALAPALAAGPGGVLLGEINRQPGVRCRVNA